MALAASPLGRAGDGRLPSEPTLHRAVAFALQVLPLSRRVADVVERTAVLRDPFGHRWNVGHHIEDVSPDEMQRRYDKMMEGS